MHILFLSHYFPPEVNAPATRTYEHCKHWVKMGHEVTVISCVPHHPMGKVFPGYKNKLIHKEYKDGIKAIKVFTYLTANQGFLKRTFNYVFYMMMAIMVAPFIGKPDIVISTSPQFFNGLAGYFVSRIKRCPWLLEIRDLWPGSILAVGAIKNKQIIKLLETIEHFAYRKADHIVSLTQSFQEHIQKQGVSIERISVIRNGVDLSFFQPTSKDKAYALRVGVKDKFVAAYVGTHGMAHGLDTLIETAEILLDRPDIIILMVGDGAEREHLEAVVTRKGLQNIKLLGQKPKEEMPLLWSVSDVSLVLLKKLDIFSTVIPSKIFESMAMRKPIILGVAGESKQLIEQGQCGICIEPENAVEVADAIKKLVDDHTMYNELAINGLRFVAKYFERQKLAESYEQILQGLAGEKAQVLGAR